MFHKYWPQGDSNDIVSFCVCASFDGGILNGSLIPKIVHYLILK